MRTSYLLLTPSGYSLVLRMVVEPSGSYHSHLPVGLKAGLLVGLFFS